MPAVKQEEDSYTKLRKIHELKTSLEKFGQIQQEFRDEMNRCRQEEVCLRKYKSLGSALETESKILIDELREVHTDFNNLESTIKESEQEQSRSKKEARRLLQELVSLKDHINSFKYQFNSDPLPLSLPDKLVDNEDVQRLMPDSPQSTSGPPPQLFPPPDLSFPYSANEALLQAIYNQAMAQQQPPNFGSEQPSGEMPEASVVLTRQQPPPMKTCTACQQQIHRNAPICPMCKQKSRSKNPKKPKRKMDE